MFLAQKSNNDVDIEQRGDSPVLVMHGGVTKSIFAHLLPAKGMDFKGCENVVKMIAKDLDSLAYRRVVFRCETNLPFLHCSGQCCWHGSGVLQETCAEGDPQSNGAEESSVKTSSKACQIDKAGGRVRLWCGSVGGS